MRGRTAVSINDDLAASQASITIRPTDKKFTSGIDVPNGMFVDPAFWQSFTYMRLNNFAHVF